MFKIGNTVRVKHEKLNDWGSQSKGNNGIITNAPYMGLSGKTWVHVRWSHGYTDSYPVKDLELVEETFSPEDFEKVLRQIKEKEGEIMPPIRKGIRVKPNKDHKDYERWKHQHEDSFGTVKEQDDEDWWSVKWDNGKDGYVYPKEFLLPVEYDMESPQQEVPVEELPPYESKPFLPGERVFINPEIDRARYEVLMDKTEGKSGYVVMPGMSDSQLMKWNEYELISKREFCVDVLFDNGRKLSMRNGWLLPIDEPAVEVTRISTNYGNVHFLINNASNKNLDIEVIRDGAGIDSRRLFNDEWRKTILEGIASRKQRIKK